MIAPKDLHHLLPLNKSNTLFVDKSRNEIREILNGTNDRIILIVGPCSIHNVNAALTYAEKLKKLALEVSDTMLLIMRVYFEKPRTALGWKGFIYDPHLDGSHDFKQGLIQTRQLLLNLANLEIPTATEFLNPLISHYVSDLISWGCIGARTVASSVHRQMASALPMPMGLKNCTSGNIDTAVSGALVATHSHYHLDIDATGFPHFGPTSGNPDAHIVLRGGENRPNYDAAALSYAYETLEKAGLPPRLIVDCSHDNSCRNHENQPHVFKTVLQTILNGDRNIKGIALESNLKAGNQSYLQKDIDPEISLTDPCLDWNMTESLIRFAAERLQTVRFIHA